MADFVPAALEFSLNAPILPHIAEGCRKKALIK